MVFFDVFAAPSWLGAMTCFGSQKISGCKEL